MSHLIPPGTPKAVKAAAVGRELVRALGARNVSRKELARTTGVGLTSLDNYRTGRALPKVEVGQTLAAVLNWPRLAELVVAARTFPCGRSGCPRTFRNDTGAPRRYCSDACQRIAANLRLATVAARRLTAGTDPGKQRAAQIARLRSGLRIADERALVLEDAIALMCAGCEPEGRCRTPACPLRPHSPLPLAVHHEGVTRTLDVVRVEARAKAAPKLAAAMRRAWADPVIREQRIAATVAGVARMTPEQIAERNRRISEGRRGKSNRQAPWSNERRANHRAAMQAAAERRRLLEVPA